MNTLILYAMGLASLAVLIAGAFFIVVMIIYAAQRTWEKVSACAQNTKDYLLHKQDYLIYKRDFVYWEEAKRAKADRCRSCEYRKKVLEQEEAQP